MKLIKQSKLFFKEGSSDKVYEIDLCKLSETEYVVNFRYGRRDAKLKEGTKTGAAVSAEQAENIFAALENEKRNKGYQSDAEMFVELPQINVSKPTSVKETILLRLQDALDKSNSFKTEWKTSRVIWKAAALNMSEAIPFILKLASRGDEMQLYSSLKALIQFQVKEAEPLFRSYALSVKQKTHIRDIATEGWITIAANDTALQNEIAQMLIDKLPYDIKYDIQTQNMEALKEDLFTFSRNGNVKFFSDFYLLARIQPQLLPLIPAVVAEWKFAPPYFRQIRSLYKLGQIRNDHTILGLLSYRFEKETPMFSRTKALDSTEKQYIGFLNKKVNVGRELKQPDSNLAFSQFTKAYFQRNSVNTLKAIGSGNDGNNYLKLAVSILLQYTEADYSKAKETPLQFCGSYNNADKKYHFTIGVFPECFNSILLTTILFGNDNRRILQADGTFLIDKYTVKSDSYYYHPQSASSTEVSSGNSRNIPKQEDSLLGSVQKFVKNIFGKKVETVSPEKPVAEEEAVVEVQNQEIVKFQDLKLYPQYWDEMPKAYIQLLMQAKMNLIHQFAYENLTNRADLLNLISRLDAKAVLILLTSNFPIPAQFGYDALLQKESEFIANPKMLIEVLYSLNNNAVEWAKNKIIENQERYLNELDFVLALITNTDKRLYNWIDQLLKQIPFTNERKQAILGKLVVEMMQWENTADNNEKAKTVAERILYLAQNMLQDISWHIIEQLVLSPLDANILLASHITVQKVNSRTITDVPFPLIRLYLQSDFEKVRANGLTLLELYPSHYFESNISSVFGVIFDNPYSDVVYKVIAIAGNTINQYSLSGNDVMQKVASLLVRKETFQGAHGLIITFANDKLNTFWNSGLSTKNLLNILFSNYRECQLFGLEILDKYTNIDKFTIPQVVALAGHELLAVRQWVWQYYKNNEARIKYEKDKSLTILDCKWDDTREFAFHYFDTRFSEKDWDAETLIGITDSIRTDVENFGRGLITKYFNEENGLEYLTKLSQHPSMNIQGLVTNYLVKYAGGKPEVIAGLEHYFRTVLTKVNKARVSKDRIFRFLENEALANLEAASVIVAILDDLSAQSTVQDKSTCIHILTRIGNVYPHLDMHLSIKN